jgi:hypothetical protein
MKKDKINAATALVEKLKSDIMALPGMIQFTNAMNPEGTGCIVSMIDSEKTAACNADATKAIWDNFCDHLTAPPKAEGFVSHQHWAA